MLQLIKDKAPQEFDTRERCSIIEILNDDKSPDLSIARCRVKPGITTELHSLENTRETYAIEAGEGLMDDGKCEPFVVKPGDNIIISSGHPQRVKNNGQTDLVFVVFCTPRFKPECYVPLEGGQD